MRLGKKLDLLAAGGLDKGNTGGDGLSDILRSHMRGSSMGEG